MVGSTIAVRFEAAFYVAEVHLNGKHICTHARMPYLGFSCRLDNATAAPLRYGASARPNVLSVRVDASWGSGHWYEGGGLWRTVQLLRISQTAHLVEDGLFVSPDRHPDGSVSVEAEVETHAPAPSSPANTTVRFSLWDDGTGAVPAPRTLLATCERVASLAAAPTTVPCSLVPSVPLEPWSVRVPRLYTVSVEVLSVDLGAPIVHDALEVRSGFRSAAWHPDNGFSLNGQRATLRGFSHHHSLAGVGAAMEGIERLQLFVAQAARALGANMHRMTHHPYASATYHLLDELGTLTWDENRAYGDDYLRAMRTMVKRDRSHPSVVVWALCNERECYKRDSSGKPPETIPALDTELENATAFAFRSAVHDLDPTHRAVAANLNGNIRHYLPVTSPQRAALDVIGFSHEPTSMLERFRHFTTVGHPRYGPSPKVPMVLSEGAGCISQRLPYLPTPRHPWNSTLPSDRSIPTCMPTSNAPGLLPYVAGSLGVWTLFDYLGEPWGGWDVGYHAWPAVSSSYGQYDLAGFPKPHCYWYAHPCSMCLLRAPPRADTTDPFPFPCGQVYIQVAPCSRAAKCARSLDEHRIRFNPECPHNANSSRARSPRSPSPDAT